MVVSAHLEEARDARRLRERDLELRVLRPRGRRGHRSARRRGRALVREVVPDWWQSVAISGDQWQSVAISGRRLVREVVLEELVALAALVPRVLDGVTLPVFLGLDLLRSEISRRSVEMRGETVETIGEIGGDEGRDRWRS